MREFVVMIVGVIVGGSLISQTSQPTSKPPVDGPAARFEDALLENLIGQWKLSRKIGERQAENRVDVEWVLHHQFLQIHMKDVKNPPQYEALVLIGYEHDKSRYVIYWLDTFGGKFSEKGHGTRDGNSIQFEFRYPDGLLRNTFTWNSEAKTWHSLVEHQDEKRAWSVFCDDNYRRP